MSKPFDGLVNFFSQFGKGLATKVAKFYVFQMVPYPFIRIKFRRIGGKVFQPHVIVGICAQEAANGLSKMDLGLIPEDEQLAGDVAQQVTEEPDHIPAINGLFV